MTKAIDMLGGAIVMISDQQKALEFYSQKMGFEIKENVQDGEGRWIEVRPKNFGAPISLIDPDKEQWTPELKEQAKKRIGTRTGLWFYTKNIQSAYQTLKENGVDITNPEKQPWGVMMCRFYDQDKNEFSLLENPELIFLVNHTKQITSNLVL